MFAKFKKMVNKSSHTKIPQNRDNKEDALKILPTFKKLVNLSIDKAASRSTRG
jgi:hypothetical protein